MNKSWKFIAENNVFITKAVYMFFYDIIHTGEEFINTTNLKLDILTTNPYKVRIKISTRPLRFAITSCLPFQLIQRHTKWVGHNCKWSVSLLVTKHIYNCMGSFGTSGNAQCHMCKEAVGQLATTI